MVSSEYGERVGGDEMALSWFQCPDVLGVISLHGVKQLCILPECAIALMEAAGQARLSCVSEAIVSVPKRGENFNTSPKEVRMVIFYLLVFGSVCSTVEGVELLLLVTTVAQVLCGFSSDCVHRLVITNPSTPCELTRAAGAAAGL